MTTRTKVMFWAITIFVTYGDLLGSLCPQFIQPAVITIADDSYNEFAMDWAKLQAELRNWLADQRTRLCFLFKPLWRFHGVTLKDLEPAVVEKWHSHKQLPATQSHYNLYMSHHKKNLERAPQQRTHLLVFEEDARCVASSLIYLSEFLQRLKRLEVKWDLIYIGGMMRDFLPMNSTGGDWLYMNDSYWRPRRIYNTEAMVINSQSVEKAAEKLKPANQRKPRSGDVSLSIGIEEGELIALVPTQRSCVQPKLGGASTILFKHKDRRWYAVIDMVYQLIPLHSND